MSQSIRWKPARSETKLRTASTAEHCSALLCAANRAYSAVHTELRAIHAVKARNWVTEPLKDFKRSQTRVGPLETKLPALDRCQCQPITSKHSLYCTARRALHTHCTHIAHTLHTDPVLTFRPLALWDCHQVRQRGHSQIMAPKVCSLTSAPCSPANLTQSSFRVGTDEAMADRWPALDWVRRRAVSVRWQRGDPFVWDVFGGNEWRSASLWFTSLLSQTLGAIERCSRALLTHSRRDPRPKAVLSIALLSAIQTYFESDFKFLFRLNLN